MTSTNTHVYDLVKHTPKENKWELRCPICDRHVVLIQQPFSRITLNEGILERGADQNHTFGTGGLVMGTVEIRTESDTFWDNALKTIGLEDQLEDL